VYLQINKRPNPAVIRNLLELQTETASNITPDKIAMAMELAELQKTTEAAKAMAKARMSPAHPAFRSLVDQAIQDIKGGRLTVPSLLIWGYNDRVTAYESGVAFFSILNATAGESEFQVFNNAGHYVFYDYPGRFNRAVVDFCGRQTSAMR
jgi:pimeloyl-ACP methyl ester carboxylesterase